MKGASGHGWRGGPGWVELGRARGLRGDQAWGSQGVLRPESVHILMDVQAGRQGGVRAYREVIGRRVLQASGLTVLEAELLCLKPAVKQQWSCASCRWTFG